MRMKIQGRLMQADFIEIHEVFAKNKKVGYFSNRLVNMSRDRGIELKTLKKIAQDTK